MASENWSIGLYDLFLFDLDGTISDPAEGIWRSLNHALSHFGFEPIERQSVGRYIGPPLDETFATITGLSSPHDTRNLVDKYRERYADMGYAENVVYPGVGEALRLLHETGIPLAVCTSKRADFAKRILQLFELDHHFQFVDGGDVGIQKWQQIGALLREGRVSVNSLMIGDRSVDLIAAHRNGLSAAGVLWGYGSRPELSGESPAHLLETPCQLRNLVTHTRQIAKT